MVAPPPARVIRPGQRLLLPPWVRASSRRVQVASGSWTPADLSGKVTWFDFSAAANLRTETDGSGAVTADADPIGTLIDLSGNGNDAFAAVDGARAVYKTGIQNGLSVGRFGGAAALVASLASKVTTTTTTIIVAGVRTSIVGNYQAWGSLYDQAEAHDYNTALNCLVCYHGPSGGTLQGYRVNDKSQTTHPGNGVPYLTVEVYDAANHTIYHNGSGATPVASTGSFGYDRHSVGARWESATLLRHMTGDLFEIIVCSGALDSTDRGLVEAYLNAKWDIY